MYNHFRTLLLNLGYQDNTTEHIPVSFANPIALPSELNSFYNLIFPINSSRFYKIFLVTNYLQLIEATPYREVIIKLDTRISYALNNVDYFKIKRNSNPALSNSAFPIFVYGSYTSDIASDDLMEVIEITQIGSTNKINVYSPIKNKYYLEDYLLVFTDNISQLVEIPGLKLSFQISGVNFTGSANKKWSFISESPYVFDFTSIFSKISNAVDTTERMLGYKRNEVDEKYELLWRSHPNSVYKMTGLISAYSLRVNAYGGY